MPHVFLTLCICFSLKIVDPCALFQMGELNAHPGVALISLLCSQIRAIDRQLFSLLLLLKTKGHYKCLKYILDAAKTKGSASSPIIKPKSPAFLFLYSSKNQSNASSHFFSSLHQKKISGPTNLLGSMNPIAPTLARLVPKSMGLV